MNYLNSAVQIYCTCTALCRNKYTCGKKLSDISDIGRRVDKKETSANDVQCPLLHVTTVMVILVKHWVKRVKPLDNERTIITDRQTNDLSLIIILVINIIRSVINLSETSYSSHKLCTNISYIRDVKSSYIPFK